MKKTLPFVFACLVGAIGSPANGQGQKLPKKRHFPLWPSRLQADVMRAARRFHGEFALYVKDLSSGALYTFNANTPVYLASGIKIPVMIELFRQEYDGRLAFEDSVIYRARDVRDGSPVLSRLPVETSITLQDLLNAMIRYSDNAATDMLINHLGIENVNEGLKKEGVSGFGTITTLLDVRRLVYRELHRRGEKLGPQEIYALRTTKPRRARIAKLREKFGMSSHELNKETLSRAYDRYYDSGYNSAAIREVGILLEKMARGQMLSPAICSKMLEVMLGTKTGVRRIRAGLPVNTPVAHKTGTQYGRINDFSIFYMPDKRPIVFAVSVKGSSMWSSERLIARVARKAFWHLSPADLKRKLSKNLPRAERKIDPEHDEDFSDDELLMP